MLNVKKILTKILTELTTLDSYDYIVERGYSGIWTYRKWKSGTVDCFGNTTVASNTYSANNGAKNIVESLPSGLFNNVSIVNVSGKINGNIQTDIGFTEVSTTSVQTYLINRATSSITNTGTVYWHVIGVWK